MCEKLDDATNIKQELQNEKKNIGIMDKEFVHAPHSPNSTHVAAHTGTAQNAGNKKSKLTNNHSVFSRESERLTAQTVVNTKHTTQMLAIVAQVFVKH